MHNKIMKIASIFLLVLLACQWSYAQRYTSDDDCQLDEAKMWFMRGNLDRIPSIENCVMDRKSMSR